MSCYFLRFLKKVSLGIILFIIKKRAAIQSKWQNRLFKKLSLKFHKNSPYVSLNIYAHGRELYYAQRAFPTKTAKIPEKTLHDIYCIKELDENGLTSVRKICSISYQF